MEQLIFLLVVGFIGLIKWLMEKSAEQRAKHQTQERLDRLERSDPSSPPPIHAPRPISRTLLDPDVAARKLREALGIPDESELSLPSHPTVEPPPPAPVEEVKIIPAQDLEPRIIAPIPPLPLKKTAVITPTQLQKTERILHSNLNELLRSREGLRKAILVQEILGTPKGLVF